jgi:Peptidase family M28
MQDVDNLHEHVKTLATGDGRSIRTFGHKRARKYLCANLKHLGLAPYSGDSYELSHGSGDNELVNIIAVAPGLNGTEPPVLIGAHYDTFGPLPGADDNAAGNAILLEIGKSLVQSPAACDVILAFFDGEELGCLHKSLMGSTKFYEEQSIRPVRCGLILDLVGHDVPIPGLESTMFVTGMESSSTWSQLLRNSEPELGLHWATVLDSYVGSLSDHHVYVTNEQPYLFFSCGRWAHYHQASDTFEKLNYAKMAVFKDALLSIIRASAELIPERSEYDSTEDELFFLRRNLLPNLGMREIPLQSRKDIDNFVATMIKRFSL